MKKQIFLLAMAVFGFAAIASAITKTVGGSGADYPTLKAAFDSINAGSVTGDIVLQLTGNSSETSSDNSVFSINASGSGSASYSSILIYPTADSVVVQGNTNATLRITLNGADNITIDGRKHDASGNVLSQDVNLSFNGGAPILSFSAAATNNTFKYINLTANGSGNDFVAFNADTSGGSDNNTFEHCNISAANFNLVRNGITVSTATAGNETDNLTLQNNNFFNCLKASASGSFINVGNYARNFTISGNSFYLTSALAINNTNAYYIIYLGGTYNQGHIVENNYIGGSGPQCTGLMQINKTSASYLNFSILYVNKSIQGSTLVTVRNNIFKNIEIGANATGDQNGIYLTGSDNVDSQISLINANLIAGIDVKGEATFNGIQISKGTYLLTNNILSISTTSGAIKGFNISSSNNNHAYSIYNNTIYIGGTANTTTNSFALYYGATKHTNKKIKNNVFVNVRSNAGSGKNYAAYFSGAPEQLDYNDYYVSSASNNFLGLSGTTDVNLLPIVTGTDGNSITIDPSFTISNPTVAQDYKSTVTQLQSGGATDISVADDYEGTTRTSNQMGAFFITGTTTGMINIGNAKHNVFQAANGSLTITSAEGASINIYNLQGVSVSKIQRANSAEQFKLAAGAYIVSVNKNGAISNQKILVK